MYMYVNPIIITYMCWLLKYVHVEYITCYLQCYYKLQIPYSYIHVHVLPFQILVEYITCHKCTNSIIVTYMYLHMLIMSETKQVTFCWCTMLCRVCNHIRICIYSLEIQLEWIFHNTNGSLYLYIVSLRISDYMLYEDIWHCVSILIRTLCKHTCMIVTLCR